MLLLFFRGQYQRLWSCVNNVFWSWLSHRILGHDVLFFRRWCQGLWGCTNLSLSFGHDFHKGYWVMTCFFLDVCVKDFEAVLIWSPSFESWLSHRILGHDMLFLDVGVKDFEAVLIWSLSFESWLSHRILGHDMLFFRCHCQGLWCCVSVVPGAGGDAGGGGARGSPRWWHCWPPGEERWVALASGTLTVSFNYLFFWGGGGVSVGRLNKWLINFISLFTKFCYFYMYFTVCVMISLLCPYLKL